MIQLRNKSPTYIQTVNYFILPMDILLVDEKFIVKDDIEELIGLVEKGYLTLSSEDYTKLVSMV